MSRQPDPVPTSCSNQRVNPKIQRIGAVSLAVDSKLVCTRHSLSFEWRNVLPNLRHQCRSFAMRIAFVRDDTDADSIATRACCGVYFRCCYLCDIGIHCGAILLRYAMPVSIAFTTKASNLLV